MDHNLRSILIRTINDLEERCDAELSPSVLPFIHRENQAAIEYALHDSNDQGLASLRLRAAVTHMRHYLGGPRPSL